MPGEVSIQVFGTGGMRQKLRPGYLTKAPILEMLTEIAEVAEREAKAGAPKDLGWGADHIYAIVTPEYAEIVAPDDYMFVQEFGRTPGRAMPPMSALAGWAQRHGFTGSTYVLARSIGQKGFRGKLFMTHAAEHIRQNMPQYLNKAIIRIERLWSE